MARFCREPHEYDPCILLVSTFHMFRAKDIEQANGLPAVLLGFTWFIAKQPYMKQIDQYSERGISARYVVLLTRSSMQCLKYIK